MGRYRAMPAAGEGDGTDPKPPPASMQTRSARGDRHVIAPLHCDIDLERYQALHSLAIRQVDPRYAASAIESAKRLWCRVGGFAASTDRIAAPHVARYLALESERVGGFDYRSAFRRANVDRYLMDIVTRKTTRSMRTIKWILYDVGRLVHPREYPEARSVWAPRPKRITAASPEDIRNWYALAPSLPPSLRQRLILLLDLCYGAGARPPDFKILRGTSISHEVDAGRTVAVVRLPNTAGGTRQVPVLDPDISRRLLNLARARGSEYLHPATKGQVERNAANRTAERLRERGHRTISAAALRNRWIMDLIVTPIPPALLPQLADVIDFQIIADQRDLLPTYGLRHTISLMSEGLAPRDHRF